jgi:hypothetical protein
VKHAAASRSFLMVDLGAHSPNFPNPTFQYPNIPSFQLIWIHFMFALNAILYLLNLKKYHAFLENSLTIADIFDKNKS